MQLTHLSSDGTYLCAPGVSRTAGASTLPSGNRAHVSSSNGSSLSVLESTPNSRPASSQLLLLGSQIAVRLDQLEGGPEGVAPPRNTRPSARPEPLQSPRTKSKLGVGLSIALHAPTPPFAWGSKISPRGVSEPASESSPPIAYTRPSLSTPEAKYSRVLIMSISDDQEPVSYFPLESGVSRSHSLPSALCTSRDPSVNRIMVSELNGPDPTVGSPEIVAHVPDIFASWCTMSSRRTAGSGRSDNFIQHRSEWLWQQCGPLSGPHPPTRLDFRR